MPRKADNPKINRGFAFVEFNQKEEAEKAITDMNTKPWKGRTVTLQFSVPKAAYEHKIESLMQHTKMTKQDASTPKVLRDERKKALELKEEREKQKEKAEAEKLKKIREKKLAKKEAKKRAKAEEQGAEDSGTKKAA